MKGKLLTIGLPVLASFLVILWITARLTGWINIYKSPSESNLPTIRLGQYFCITKLKSPARFDLIAYKPLNGLDNSGQIYMHRLIGMPGDSFRIENGVAYINQQNADKGLRLTNTYKIAKTEKETLTAITDADIEVREETDSMLVFLPTDSKLLSQATVLVHSMPAKQPNAELQNVWHKPWDQYNFGPIVIPANNFFVLGDNRENALDSRYTGFVKRKSVVGVKL